MDGAAELHPDDGGDSGGGGTINPAAGVHAYTSGTVVAVTATPASGYTFSSWSGACSGTGACSVTMDAQQDRHGQLHRAISGGVTSAATPSNAAPSTGQQIVVSINIDMSGASAPDNALGSFTGSLAWNTAVLTYSSNTGIGAGFTGNVNTGSAGSGSIAFNGANTTGATGNNVVLTITFDVVGGGTSALDLGYSAMAAASYLCEPAADPYGHGWSGCGERSGPIHADDGSESGRRRHDQSGGGRP